MNGQGNRRRFFVALATGAWSRSDKAHRQAQERKQWPRLSVLNLVLITTTIAAVLGLFVHENERAERLQLQRQVFGLTKGFRNLRNVITELYVTDPNKLNFVRAPSGEPFSWKWRVWLPAGKSYTLHSMGLKIAASTCRRAGEFDEFFCEYKMRSNAQTGLWEQVLTISRTGNDEWPASQQKRVVISRIRDPSWLENPTDVVFDTTDSHLSEGADCDEADRLITLLSYRVSKKAISQNRLAGSLLWFEPED